MANQLPKIDSRIGELPPPIKHILEEMFANYQEIILLSEFTSDLGQSRMFVLRPITISRAELYALVKIDSAAAIRREWQAYEAYLRNKLSIANIHEEPMLLPGNQYGGLCYTLTRSSVLELISLAEYWKQASVEDVDKTLVNLLQTMEELWEQYIKVQANANLLTIYDSFLPANLIVELTSMPPDANPKWLDPTTARHNDWKTGELVQLGHFQITEIELDKNRMLLDSPESSNAFHLFLEGVSDDIDQYEIGGVIEKPITGVIKETRQNFLISKAKELLPREIDLTMETISVRNDFPLPNPLLHYSKAPIHYSDVHISCIHGSFHLHNVLVERSTELTHLINFGKSRKDHVLRDLLHLEMSIIMNLLPQCMDNTQSLPETIYTLFWKLHCPPLQQNVTVSNDLDLIFSILKRIRQAAHHHLFKTDEWGEYYNGLGLCLLGALKFNHLNIISCQTAFWGSSVAFHLAQTDIDCPDPPKPEMLLARSSHIPQTLNFVDRKKELKILNEYKQSCQVIVIQGPSGIGKSYLTKRWAQQLIDRNIPVILINCRPNITIDIDYIIDAFAGINPNLDVRWRLQRPGSLEPIYKGIQYNKKAAEEVLIALETNGYMLIFDAYEEILNDESLNVLLESTHKWLQDSCVVLVTQERPRNVDTLLSKIGQIDLNELPLDDARTYLNSLLKRNYADTLGSVMNDIGGLPMHLNWIANKINHRNPTSEELISEIPRYRQKFSEWLFQDIYESLSQFEKEMLCHLAILSEPITRSAAMTLFDFQTQKSGVEAFEKLQDRSLIFPTHTEIGEFVVHKMAREFARRRMGDDLYRSANLKAARLYLSSDKSELNPSETSTEVDNKLTAFKHFLNANENDQAVQIVEELRKWLTDHGRYKQAIEILKKAIQILGEKGLQVADFCWNLAQIYEYQAEYDEALEWLDRGRNALNNQDNTDVAARIALWFGIVHVRRGDKDSAIPETREAIRIAESVSAKSEAARAHNLQGLLHRVERNLLKAHSECTTSADIYETLNDKYGIAAAYSSIGVVTFELGDWNAAEEAYKRALQAQFESNDLYGEMLTSTNYADLLAHRGQFDESMKLVERTLELAVRLNSALGEAHAYATQGLIHLLQQQFDQALAQYNMSSELMEERGIKDFGVWESIHLGRAEIHLVQKDLSQAEAEAQQIDTETARLRLLGQIQLAGGNLSEAEETLQQSLDSLKDDEQPYEQALTLMALATHYFIEGGHEKHTESSQLLNGAISIFESLDAAPALKLAKGLQK